MTADRNGPFSVVRYGHSFFSSESEFPEISPSNISIEQKGSVPKKKKKKKNQFLLNIRVFRTKTILSSHFFSIFFFLFFFYLSGI